MLCHVIFLSYQQISNKWILNPLTVLLIINVQFPIIVDKNDSTLQTLMLIITSLGNCHPKFISI